MKNLLQSFSEWNGGPPRHGVLPLCACGRIASGNPQPGCARLSPAEEAEQRALLANIKDAIDEALTPHQRRVLVALVINGVPIDELG